MEVPAFSIFSAISEVFVTIAVLYAVISNMNGKPLNWKLLGLVLTFELCVNVVYMAGRASHADTDTTLSTGMKLFFAGHGILSLAMFLGIVVLFILAVMDVKSGRDSWFQRHRTGSWIFVFFWMVSVISGEAIFFMRFGGALFS
jgi:uncharacterized membrane protein YozB (DUF420 family)